MLVLLLVDLCFFLRGDLLYVFPCVILFLCFPVLLALRLPRWGKRELILGLFVRLFDLCLFGFVGFLFLLVSGKGYGLWLWHSLGFSLTIFDWTPRTLSESAPIHQHHCIGTSNNILAREPPCRSSQFQKTAGRTNRLYTYRRLSLISNNRFFLSDILIPVITKKSKNR